MHNAIRVRGALSMMDSLIRTLSMSALDRISSIRSDRELEKQAPAVANFNEDPDAEFGGTEERKRLEKKLLRKIDMRMSILVIIYILNYVSLQHL